LIGIKRIDELVQISAHIFKDEKHMIKINLDFG